MLIISPEKSNSFGEMNTSSPHLMEWMLRSAVGLEVFKSNKLAMHGLLPDLVINWLLFLGCFNFFLS